LESSRKALVLKELLAPARFVADSPLEGDIVLDVPKSGIIYFLTRR